LWGYSGNDTIFGEAGNDTLYGGAGNDTVYGGAGKDFMDGGPGYDVYKFSNIHDLGLGNARDIIVYDDATDRIDLSDIITPAFTFIGATTFFTGVNQVGVRTEGANTIIALNTAYTPVISGVFDPYPEAEIIAQDRAYTVADYQANDFIL
jgi:Ca2+-binding RTX toxin-like protein